MLAEPTACAAGSPTGREAVLLVMYTAAPSCPLDPSANICSYLVLNSRWRRQAVNAREIHS